MPSITSYIVYYTFIYMPLGKNTIEQLLPDLRHQARVITHYTGHCLRASFVTQAYSADLSGCDIMADLSTTIRVLGILTRTLMLMLLVRQHSSLRNHQQTACHSVVCETSVLSHSSIIIRVLVGYQGRCS